MEVLLAIALGVFFAISVYTIQRRNFLKVVIGFMMMSNAVNLMIFVVGRLTRTPPPLIPHGAKTLEGDVRQPAAPSADSDRHRDQLRLDRLRAHPSVSGLSNLRHFGTPTPWPKPSRVLRALA